MSTAMKRPSLLSNSDSDTEEDTSQPFVNSKPSGNNLNSDDEINKNDNEKEKNNSDNGASFGINNHLKKKQRFNEDMLCNPQLGLERIYREFPQSCGTTYKGRGCEDIYLKNLISNYKEWSFQLYDKYHYNDVLDAVEKLGSKAYVRSYLNTLRDKERLRYVNKIMHISTDDLPPSFPGLASQLSETDGNTSGYTTGISSIHTGTDDYKRKRTPLTSDTTDSNASIVHKFDSQTIYSPHAYGDPSYTPMVDRVATAHSMVSAPPDIDDEALLEMMEAYNDNATQAQLPTETQTIIAAKGPTESTPSAGANNLESDVELEDDEEELLVEAASSVAKQVDSTIDVKTVTDMDRDVEVGSTIARTEIDESQTQTQGTVQVETQLYSS